MTKHRKTVGERLVELFIQEGVEIIFSQGDVTMREIQKHAHRNGLKVVGPRHESSAVFMADGYYKLTGKPQVAIGAMGPGQANLLPAVACAAQEHTPVIVLGASRQDTVDNKVRRGRFLHAPVFDCFRRLCKFAGKIRHPSDVDELVYEAFRQALSGTPGPVYLEYDFVMHEAEWDYPDLVPPSRYRVTDLAPSPAAVAAAAEMIAQSRLPVLLGGTAVQTSGSHRAFERLARLMGCPVMSTVGGSGAFPHTDAQWFSYYSDVGREILDSCDLVVAIGTSIPETLGYGRHGRFAAGDQGRRWILIEQDVLAVGVNHPIDLPIIGKIEEALPALGDALEQRGARARDRRMSAWRQASSAEQDADRAAIERDVRINPSELMLEAREGTPDDAIVVVDGGFTLLQQIAFFEKRSRHYVAASKYAHLGSGLPLAIGAQLGAKAGQRVCVLTGDGAFGFHFMEFETAIRHDLPIVIIVNDDQALGAEMPAHLESIGFTIEVSFSPVRYDLMAQAMGGHGAFVDRVEDIRGAVEIAFASGKPSIVQVSVDPESAAKFKVPLADELGAWLFDDAN